MTGEDLIFTGAKLHLKTGTSIAATQTEFLSMQAFKDGFYDIHIDDDVASKSNRHVFKGKSPSIKNNLLRITPAGPRRVRANWTSYIHDFSYMGLVSGIEIQPHFFRRIEAYSKERGGKKVLRLRVAKGNKAPWMETAKSQIGVKEKQGAGTDPTVMSYHAASGWWGKEDNNADPWCGSFVAWVMKENNFVPPQDAFRAKEWINFGTPIPKSAPTYGAIAVKNRSGGGHVGFVVGTNTSKTKLYILGGNQDDSVNVTEYPRDVFTNFCLPKNYNAAEDWLPIHTSASVAAGSEA